MQRRPRSNAGQQNQGPWFGSGGPEAAEFGEPGTLESLGYAVLIPAQRGVSVKIEARSNQTVDLPMLPRCPILDVPLGDAPLALLRERAEASLSRGFVRRVDLTEARFLRGMVPRADEDWTSIAAFHDYARSLDEAEVPDHVESARWYRFACEAGYAPSINSLGYCLKHEEGTPRDDPLGSKFYLLAASLGWPKAMANWALLIAQHHDIATPRGGITKAETLRIASHWNLAAALQHHAFAGVRLVSALCGADDSIRHDELGLLIHRHLQTLPDAQRYQEFVQRCVDAATQRAQESLVALSEFGCRDMQLDAYQLQGASSVFDARDHDENNILVVAAFLQNAEVIELLFNHLPLTFEKLRTCTNRIGRLPRDYSSDSHPTHRAHVLLAFSPSTRISCFLWCTEQSRGNMLGAVPVEIWRYHLFPLVVLTLRNSRFQEPGALPDIFAGLVRQFFQFEQPKLIE